MNSKQKGGVGVATAAAYLAKKGDLVYLPMSESGCDLVVDRDGTLLRVEVKATWKKNSIDLRTKSGWYTTKNVKLGHISERAIDLVIGYNGTTDTVTEFTIDQVAGRSIIVIP